MSDRGKKEAFVTLATNDTYSLGCLVLGSSLRHVGTTRQLVVMVTTGVTNAMRTQLAQVFDVIQEVNVLDSCDPINLSLLGRPDLNVTFTKLHCWRLTQFDKAVFLDADTLVLQNVDELFDREELSASPDAGWPDCFNSGVFVFKPSEETYNSILSFATSKGSFDGGDQGLLNLYFSDWATKDINKHLPFIYNVVSQAFYSYLPAFTQFRGRVKIVHFIGAVKPWHHTYNTSTNVVTPLPGTGHCQEFLQVWWTLFMEMVRPNLDPSLQEEFSRISITRVLDHDHTNTITDHCASWPPGQSGTKVSGPSVTKDSGPSVMKVVYPYKNPEVTKVFYTTSEETDGHLVDMEVIPRTYTELESHYSEEPFTNMDAEDPSDSMYDATSITKGWEKSGKASDEEATKSSEKFCRTYDTREEDTFKSFSIKKESKDSTSIKNESNDSTSVKNESKDSASSSPSKVKRPSNLKTEVGLVSQMGSLSIQGASQVSPVELSDQERKLNWEKGCIDYLGQDAFSNIQRKIDESLSPQSPKEAPTEEAQAPIKPTPAPIKPTPAPTKPTLVSAAASKVPTPTEKKAAPTAPAKPVKTSSLQIKVSSTKK